MTAYLQTVIALANLSDNRPGVIAVDSDQARCALAARMLRERHKLGPMSVRYFTALPRLGWHVATSKNADNIWSDVHSRKRRMYRAASHYPMEVLGVAAPESKIREVGNRLFMEIEEGQKGSALSIFSTLIDTSLAPVDADKYASLIREALSCYREAWIESTPRKDGMI